MLVRERLAGDLPAVEALARQVHRRDHYPIYMPDDLHAFLVSEDAMAAWVAVDDTGLLGHVALHSRSWAGVMRMVQEKTGWTAGDLAVVARLMVTPDRRRGGTGAALLEVAVAQARHLGRRAILDVAVKYAPAVALYERCGWTRLGTVAFPLPEGGTVDEYVYVSPD